MVEESNCINAVVDHVEIKPYNHRMFGVVENMKVLFTHSNQICMCLSELFFKRLKIFEQFDIGCFAIQQMQHVSLWSELRFFAVLQVHQRA